MPAPPRDPPILDPPIRLAVCVSGGGTTLQNLIDRIGAGHLDATIVQVIASRAGIGAIPRAEGAGLPLAVATRSKGDLAGFSASVFEPIRRARADLVILAGFLSLVRIHDDYAGRVLNIHPSLIPAFCGRGFHGHAVHQAALDAGAEILHAPRIFPEYHPGYYAVFVRDLDGHNVEAVHHIQPAAAES